MCSENVAIGFKTNIEDYFMEKNSATTPELLEVSKLLLNEAFLGKSANFKMVPALR